MSCNYCQPGMLCPYHGLPQQPQSQQALDLQLLQLKSLANRMGLYDAADWIDKMLETKKKSSNRGFDGIG